MRHGSKSLAMKAVSRDGYFADCRFKLPCKKADLCDVRESYRNSVFRGIERRWRVIREKKHDQTVLRKEDEWFFSNVIQKHSCECQEGILKLMHALATPKHQAAHKLSLAVWRQLQREANVAVSKVVPHSAEDYDSCQLRARILVARALRQEFGHLPGCAKLPEFMSKKNCCHQKKGRVGHTENPSSRRKRCKSVLGLKRSSTEGEAVEAVSERRDHEATSRKGGRCNARSVPEPMEQALTRSG